MSKPNRSSISCDPQKLRRLRQSLGWTQADAAKNSGYTSRVICKLESGKNVRPATLVDVLQCYHEAADCPDWQMSEFLKPENENVILFAYESFQDAARCSDPPQQQMAKLLEYFELVFCQRQIGRIGDFIAKDMVFRHGEGDPQLGCKVIQELASSMLNGFNPIEMKIESLFFLEGSVFAFYAVSMKHTGEFSGIRASSKWVSFRFNSKARFENEKVVEGQDQWDVYDVLRQLEDKPKRWF